VKTRCEKSAEDIVLEKIDTRGRSEL